MDPDDGVKFRRLTVSGEVARGPTDFYGLIIQATGTYETLTVYACPDENTMYLFDTFVNRWKGSNPYLFPKPVYFDEGLYIKITGAITSVLVFFRDLPT